MKTWRDRLPLITVRPWLLTFLLLLLFIQLLFSFFFKENATIEFYYLVGLNRETFLKGQIWGLFSYGLFHHPQVWSHLILNALFLFYLAGRVTHILGSKQCLILLFLGVMGAGVLHLLIDPMVRISPAPLIGISGGVCALLAALCTLAPDSRFFPLMVRGKNLLVASLVTSLFFFFSSPKLGVPFLSEIGEFLYQSEFTEIFSIGHACHMGGILVGTFYVNWLLRPMRLRKRV